MYGVRAPPNLACQFFVTHTALRTKASPQEHAVCCGRIKYERSSIPFRAPRPNEPPMPTQAAAERFIRDFMSQGGERRISPEYLPLFRWLLLRNPRVFLTWDGITAFVGRTGAHPCLLFYSKQYDNTFTVSYSRCIAMDAEKAANEWCKAVNGNSIRWRLSRSMAGTALLCGWT